MSGSLAQPSLVRPGRDPVGFAAASTLITAEAQEMPVCSMSGECLPTGSTIELGYFDQATIHALFAGAWTPLIGIDAPRANRSISPIFCGNAGEAEGRFVWCRTFFAGIDALPPVGRPLALRIYDHPNTTDALFYNTVSHPSWWFREPRSPSPAFVYLNLDEPDVRWESGPQGAYRTTLRTRARFGAHRGWRRALAVFAHRRDV